VVLGSEQRVTRDVKAKELCERGFASAVISGRTAPVTENLPVVKTSAAAGPEPAQQASTNGAMSVNFRVIPPAKP
jgi:hypothetical protein